MGKLPGRCSAPIIAILLAGCGGSTSNGHQDVRFASSADLRDALGKAGLSCNDFTSNESSDREWGTEAAADVASCTLESENVKLIVWKDNGQKDNWSGMVKTMGCKMGKAITGISEFNYADGDRWTIEQTSETLAKKISDGIGGQAEHISCDG